MRTLVEKLCQEYRLTIVQQLTAGNICDAVYRVRDESGTSLVLKVGESELTVREIAMNLVGYQNLRNLGLPHFIPKVVDYRVDKDSAFILLEDCGPDFLTLSRITQQPLLLYQNLAEKMLEIYRRSHRQGEDGQIMVDIVSRKIVEQYDLYLSHLNSSESLRPRLVKLSYFTRELGIGTYCFSSWDFTPEDIYLTNGQVKYGDPHEQVTGIPIIDLACFGGVVRDAYQLPGSMEGYDILRNVAKLEVAPLLGVSEEVGYSIFLLGRVLQCFLSSRFRLKTEPIRAVQLFEQAKMYLTQAGF